MAASIARFPQDCMLADRESAYYSTFTAKSFEDALVFEHEKGKHIIVNEAISGNISAVSGTTVCPYSILYELGFLIFSGAKGFVSGLGKHGKFNFSAEKISDTVHSQKN